MKKAFTLAEVLISLAIIGVVAALTIPTLIQNYEEKVTVVKLKKVYSVLTNAYQLAQLEKGNFNNNEEGITSKNFYDYIAPYLKVQKYCGVEKGCWPDTMIKFLHGADWENLDNYRNYEKAIINDGMLLQIYTADRNDLEGEIRVDINGFKKPNTLGKDIFYFKIKNAKLIPLGDSNSDSEDAFKKHCNMTSTDDYNGDACTAWVIYNENMDYLHCNDLSWGGKHSCKAKKK